MAGCNTELPGSLSNGPPALTCIEALVAPACYELLWLVKSHAFGNCFPSSIFHFPPPTFCRLAPLCTSVRNRALGSPERSTEARDGMHLSANSICAAAGVPGRSRPHVSSQSANLPLGKFCRPSPPSRSSPPFTTNLLAFFFHGGNRRAGRRTKPRFQVCRARFQIQGRHCSSFPPLSIWCLFV